MKTTGIVRRIDDVGRINIPKEIRMQIFGTQATVGEPMEILLDGNDIVLRKYESEEKRKEKEIRNKAIDEFVERIEQYCSMSEMNRKMIQQIAEEMRGTKNE